MSADKKLKLVVTAGLLLVVLVACRKNSLGPYTEPESVYTPMAKTNNTLMLDKPVNILSSYEIKNKRPFRGRALAKLGNGMVGAGGEITWAAFEFVSKALWEAFDFHKTKANFADISNQISGIQGQISEIEAELEYNRKQFKFEIDQTKAYLQSSDLEVQFDYVEEAMSPYLQSGLLYMTNIAKAYQADSLNPVNIKNMEAMKTLLQPLAKWRIYQAQGNGTMPLAISIMKSLICPASGQDVGVNALKSVAQTLIPLCQGQVTDSISAMNAYSLLEGYFLKVVNYQLQAAIVYANYCNVIDPTGKYASTFWGAYVQGVIPEEVDKFLEQVDYLAVNLSEYRTEHQYMHDMRYLSYGIAPDNLFYNVYARSQFLANLLYAVSLKSYSRINCHILLPRRYTTDGSAPNDPVSLTMKIGQETAISKVSRQISQIPYTYWKTTTTEQQCYPDHEWIIHKISTAASNSDLEPAPKTIEIISNDSITPWYHSAKSLMTTIKPLYYNPFSPTQTSATKTDSCTFQFGYCAASWYWGHMLLVNNNRTISPGYPKNVWPGSEFDVHHYDNGKGNVAGVTPPKAVKYLEEKKIKPYETYSPFSFDFRNGKMTASGMIGVSPIGDYEDFCLVDSRSGSFGVSTSSQFPPSKNLDNLNAVEAWGSYSGYFNGWSGQSPHLIISVGTHSHHEGGYGYQVGDILYDEFSDFPSPLIFEPKFARKILESSTDYDPGFQYFYTTKNTKKNVEGELSIDYCEQFIYTGLYELDTR